MALGLPAALTAASFGKLINPPPPEARPSPTPSLLPSRVPSRHGSPKTARAAASVAVVPGLTALPPAIAVGTTALAAAAPSTIPPTTAPTLPGRAATAPTTAPNPTPTTARVGELPHSHRHSSSSADSSAGGASAGGGVVGATPAEPGASGQHCAWPPNETDVLSALLNMVVQASAVLAKAHCASGKAVDGSDATPIKSVFFCGGFVSANPLARAALARSLRALGTEALFFRHSEFLGAIGALARSWPGGAAAFRREWQMAPPEARLSTDDGAGADSWAAAFPAPLDGGGGLQRDVATAS